MSADEALASGSGSGSGPRSSRHSSRAGLSGDGTQVHVVADKPRTTCKYLFALARGGRSCPLQSASFVSNVVCLPVQELRR